MPSFFVKFISCLSPVFVAANTFPLDYDGLNPCSNPQGKGVLPITASTGRLHPKWVPFSGLGYMIVEKYVERLGKLRMKIKNVKMPKRANRFFGYHKERKTFWFCETVYL